MDFLVLEMRERSGYPDTATAYVFPKNYLKFFHDTPSGGQVALIYEPRREGGRQSFVAWTTVTSAPRPVSDGNYAVDLGGGLISFDRPVPFTINGSPVERRLREIERKRWGAALQGKSVRPMPAANAWEIISLGVLDNHIPDDLTGTADGIDPTERERRAVRQLERTARFRDGILKQYDYACAITGLNAGPNPASRLNGLLEAAHVMPIAARGPDDPGNGLAMTPTVHRMFDAGLFTLRAKADTLLVQTSPQLLPGMLVSPSGTRLAIEDGIPIHLPADPRLRPRREFLDYHRSEVFQSRAA